MLRQIMAAIEGWVAASRFVGQCVAAECCRGWAGRIEQKQQDQSMFKESELWDQLWVLVTVDVRFPS